jgi:hypothetical protein
MIVSKHARSLIALVFGLALVMVSAGFTAMAQNTSGSVNVTVLDPAGSAVPEANLELQNLETNELHKGSTQSNGAYDFANLPFGRYKLTVGKTGFASQAFASVEVQAARVTDIKVNLKVGATTETVTVSGGEAPLVEATSSTLSDTLDTKQVVNLPVSGRNVMSLAFLVPGFANTGVASAQGTWNNMPGGAVVGADFDGTPGISNRFRSGGFNYGTTSVQPRIEDVAEMTISTGQLDLSGTGTSAMRIAIVTRHGTIKFTAACTMTSAIPI